MLQAASFNVDQIPEDRMKELIGSLYNAKVFVRFDSQSVMTLAGTPDAMQKAQVLVFDAEDVMPKAPTEPTEPTEE